MHGVQEPKLHHHQEQEKANRAGGVQKILPFLLETHAA
jgi:hypothetical protein